MKKFLIGLLVLFFAFLTLHNPQQKVVMAPHVNQYVVEISENYPNETLACLDYFQIFEDVYIYNYSIPHTIAANGTKIAAVACKKDQISFHNHPAHNPPQHVLDYIERETGKEVISTKQHVFLSKVDILNNIKQSHPYVIVASDGYYAWWTRDQIKKASSEKLLEPIGEQKNF